MQTPGYSYPSREKFDPKAAAKYLGIAPQTLQNFAFSKTWSRLSPRRPPYLLLAGRHRYLLQPGANRSLPSLIRKEGEMVAYRQGPFLCAVPVARAHATRPELHELLPGLPRPFPAKTASYMPNDFKRWDRRSIAIEVKVKKFPP